jgi:hypothetical protein
LIINISRCMGAIFKKKFLDGCPVGEFLKEHPTAQLA